MLDTTPRKILVGVTGDEDVSGAIEFAIWEARRRRVGVHLVHVVHPVLFSPDGVPITVEERAVRALGRKALDVAAQTISSSLGEELPVSTELARDTIVGGLVSAAEHAALVVLQHQGMGHRHRIPTLSITNPVAALSPVPVVGVPAGWARPSEPLVVTVGVADPRRSTEVVRAALDQARLWGATLRILRAWRYSAYDDLLFPTAEQDAKEEKATMDALAPLLAEYSDVDIEVFVGPGRAADALARASSESSLVVVGRHRHVHPLGPHLGSIARAVLRHAVCPVMVVDPVPSAAAPAAVDLDLDSARERESAVR